MILAIDMGNTNIVVGGIDEEGIFFSERMTTVSDKTDFEFAILLSSLLNMYHVKPSDIEGAILSSVVPSNNIVITSAIKKITGIKPLVVHHNMNINFEFATDIPEETGADLIVSSVAAVDEYPVPLAMMDLGTATTIFVIDSDKKFRGGIIHPGVKLSIKALNNGTAQLPEVRFTTHTPVIGKNSVDCIQSGVLYGHAGMIDGILGRMEEEIGQPLTVIATGGLAPYVTQYCNHKIICDDDLLLKGLLKVYRMNS